MVTALPAVASLDGGLYKYLEEIKKFPVLEPQEEYVLAKRYRDYNDTLAAERLVTSHLRLVAKIAVKYRGYGLPMSEIISEGNIGLMQAVKRFEPDKGFRLATYARWWIQAAIQEHILRSWSLVKVGTTAAQKRLFFNLRQTKNRLQVLHDGDLKPEHVKIIATKLSVSQEEVISMNQRLSGDASLNTKLISGEDGLEWQDCLVDESPTQETVFEELQTLNQHKGLLKEALSTLNQRERHIFKARRLTSNPVTLESLSHIFGVSRERVRQIETRAFEKVQKCILSETDPMSDG